ncbi:MAG: hypothetical protein CMI28_04125 [Opitutae bacterium]|nr:hypothetical protein [Opitutae bacterium]|tara:strand:- start:515 stop:1555 length:1041 start_codon:yes stop_codon:yes gene_type:complete
MNIYVSRNGQTFGPYTAEQAKQFLETNQLLRTDFALIEGSSEWSTLPEVLAKLGNEPPVAIPSNSADESSVDTLPKTTSPTEQEPHSSGTEPKSKVNKKKGSKVQKIQRARGGQIIMVAQEKSFLSKIFSTIFVFTFLLLLAVGGIVGAYFAMPSKMGPILSRFGVNLEDFAGKTVNAASPAETKSPDEIMLSEDAWNTLRSSGIRILPIVGGKGLQVISSVDPELAMKDEDLEKLMMIAPHIISLDLTDSKVSNAGFDFIAKMPNLKKLFLEGVQEVDISGIAKLKDLKNLEYLNLIRVKLEASAVDFLISLESLREVYLFETGLDESAIGKLKTAKPQVFVNSG